MPGRPQRRAQKRKQAASTCYRLDQVIPPKKSARSLQCDTAASPRESSGSSCCDAPGRAPLLSAEIPSTCKESSIPEVTTCFPVADLGRLYQMSSSFYTTINSLSPSKKYNLLTNHKKPSRQNRFPTTYIGGCNRSFRPSWLEEHPWMVYSEIVDGVFCIYCALFLSQTSKGSFVSHPFRLWNKKGEKAKQHETSAYHKSAVFCSGTQ